MPTKKNVYKQINKIKTKTNKTNVKYKTSQKIINKLRISLNKT